MPIIPAYNTDNYIQKLTDMIGQLRADVDQLMAATKVNQLNYSSLNDTALPIFGTDSQGVAQLKARLGMQPDGTYAITYHNGNVPPNPINIGVAQRQLGILVSWDGTFAGNASRPNDFDRLDVYIDTSSGFTPSVSNLIGSLFSDSALFIGADVTPHFVKVATVNISGVASFPSFEIPVTPLPAAQLAAGSVTAITLDAELVLATEIVIGNRFDSHIQLSPDVGLALYASDGTTQLVLLDIISGGATFTGTVETKPGPDRVVITDNAGNPEIQLFRNPSGTNKAYITAVGTSANFEIDLVEHSGPDITYTPNREFVQTLSPAFCEIKYSDVGNSNSHRGGRIFVSSLRASMDVRNSDGSGSQNGGAVVVDNNSASLNKASTGYIGANIIAQDTLITLQVFDSGRLGNLVSQLQIPSSGDIILRSASGITYTLSGSTLRMRTSPFNEPELMNEVNNIGLRLANTSHVVVLDTSGNTKPIEASAFTVTSSILHKRNIIDLIDSPIKARDTIINVKVKQWNYNNEHESTTPHLFPIAEELAQVLPDSVNDNGTVDLRDIVGFLLQLCKEQEQELQSIRAELNNNE